MHDQDRRRGKVFSLLPLLVSCGLLVVAAFAGTNVAAGAIKPFTADTYSSTTDTSTPTNPPSTTTPVTPPTTTTPPPPTGGEGCTPGFWKNHPEAWAATGYDPDQTLVSVFSALAGSPYADVTLFDALSLMGGGIEALLRQAVAALLNAASPDVDYPLTTAQVIAMTNAAIASGDYETTKDLFDELNNLTAPGFCD